MRKGRDFLLQINSELSNVQTATWTRTVTKDKITGRCCVGYSLDQLTKQL